MEKEVFIAEVILPETSNIRRLSERDWPLINKWYEQHGLARPKDSMLSDLGYMVDERVAGWLYITNSGMSFIENIISDPSVSPKARSLSTKCLIGFMIDLSHSFGYDTVFGITKHPAILKYGREFGFKEQKDYKLIVLTGEE